MMAETVVLRETVYMHVCFCDNHGRGVLHLGALMFDHEVVVCKKTVNVFDMTT